MPGQTIYIASDHRGFALKSKCVQWLSEHQWNVRDLGPENDQRCDAQDYAMKLAAEMKRDAGAFGVLICGTGQVMAMTANRYQHLRAALCTNTTMAHLAREHNDANVLAMGASIVGDDVALDCLNVFLNTAHLGGRYAERVQMLTALGGL